MVEGVGRAPVVHPESPHRQATKLDTPMGAADDGGAAPVRARAARGRNPRAPSFGNPLLWWGGFAAVVYAALRWWRGDRTGRQRWSSSRSSPRTRLALDHADAGEVLLFHAVPITPFLYLALAYAYVQLAKSRPRRIAAAVAVASAATAFGFFFPILSARPLGPTQWRIRACSAQALWLERVEGCGLAEPLPGSPGTRPPALTSSSSRPVR